MPGPDISGSGFMGLAFETTPGTYVAPSKFFPILSESLGFMPNNQFRRPIRQTVDQIGMIAGNIDVTGNVTMEALDDVIVYWLYAMRTTIAKSGTGPFTYTITPVTGVTANRTLSLTVVRAGTVFGYVGCVVSKLTLSIQGDHLQAQVDIVGTNETVQALPTPTWTTNSVPFGPGMWNVQVPTATQIFDMDTFSFSIDEAFAAQYRLKNTGVNQGRGAQFVAAGERTIQLTASRDFIDRTDYNNFQANVSQSVTITAVNGANSSISFLIPVAFKSAFAIPLGAQGNLVRSNITYESVIDATGKAAQLTVITNESIT